MENLTQNNSNEMKTVIETFLTEETVDLIYDNDQLEKWNKHVKDLGLVGQTEIVKPEKSPIPFMHLKTSHKNICEQICPVKVSIERYNITPIPVEILDLVGLSKKENYFHKIQVWYDDKNPDPFVIGIVGEYYSYKNGQSKYFKSRKEALEHSDDNKASFSDWSAQHYLIGKWADVKRSWKELKEIATERFIAQRGNEYHNQIKEAKRGLEDLEMEAFDKFN